MPQYKVLIHSSNFRLKMEGKWEKYGFYTPRRIDAPDAVMAEQVALEDFRQSSKYRELLERALNHRERPEDASPLSLSEAQSPYKADVWRQLTPGERLRRSWQMRSRIPDLKRVHDRKLFPKP